MDGRISKKPGHASDREGSQTSGDISNITKQLVCDAMQLGCLRGVTLVTHQIALPPSSEGKALNMVFPITTEFSHGTALV